MTFRSLLADLLLGGTLGNQYELIGAMTIGTPGGKRLALDGTAQAALFYDAGGALTASLAPAAGSDALGNVFPLGLKVGRAGGAGAVLGYSGTTGLLYFPGVVTNILNDANAQLNNQGVGNAAQSFLTISSATDNLQLDRVASNWYSSSHDGTLRTQIAEAYVDSAGNPHFYKTLDYTGQALTAKITGITPGTGTSGANPATAETWHPAASLLSASWTTSGVTNPLRYQLQADGTVRLDGEILTTGAGPWPANATILTLPVGYRPAAPHPFITRSAIAVTAGQDTVNVLAGGGVQNGQAFTASGQGLWFDGITFPLT